MTNYLLNNTKGRHIAFRGVKLSSVTSDPDPSFNPPHRSRMSVYRTEAGKYVSMVVNLTGDKETRCVSTVFDSAEELLRKYEKPGGGFGHLSYRVLTEAAEQDDAIKLAMTHHVS